MKMFANENLFEPIIDALTDKIIAMKEANPAANTSALKRGQVHYLRAVLKMR